jgi:predicted peroxiredoxin
MRIALLAGTALICTGLAACGGSSRTVTVVKTITSGTGTTAAAKPATTTATTTTTADGKPPKCTQELTDTLQGDCMNDGVRLTVTGRAHPLVMKTMKVRYKSLRVVKTAVSSYDRATANGKFVIVKITVTNRTNRPQDFSSIGDGPAILLVDGKQYTQDINAANTADDAAFESQAKSIQPDASQTGDVVFDVPAARIAPLLDHGVILFLDFGKDTIDNPPLGAIRLYN